MQKVSFLRFRYSGILIGCFIALVASMLGCCVLSYLYLNNFVSDRSVGWLICVVQAVSAAIGSLIVKRMQGTMPLVSCGITAVAIILSYSIIHFFFFSGGFHGIMWAVAMVVIGASVPLLSEIFIKRNTGIKNIKRAFR